MSLDGERATGRHASGETVLTRLLGRAVTDGRKRVPVRDVRVWCVEATRDSNWSANHVYGYITYGLEDHPIWNFRFMVMGQISVSYLVREIEDKLDALRDPAMYWANHW